MVGVTIPSNSRDVLEQQGLKRFQNTEAEHRGVEVVVDRELNLPLGHLIGVGVDEELLDHDLTQFHNLLEFFLRTLGLADLDDLFDSVLIWVLFVIEIEPHVAIHVCDTVRRLDVGLSSLGDELGRNAKMLCHLQETLVFDLVHLVPKSFYLVLVHRKSDPVQTDPDLLQLRFFRVPDDVLENVSDK